MLYRFLYDWVITRTPDRVIEQLGEPFFLIASLLKEQIHHFMPFSIDNLTFPNPVGMPAGWIDKPRKLEIARRLGVGIPIIKTITPRPKRGNPYPRIIRKEKALINSMGLPNTGVEWWARNYRPECKFPSVVSVKGNNLYEWTTLLELLEPRTDIFELNFSCPNIGSGIMDITTAVALVEDISSITSSLVFVKLSPEYSATQNRAFVDKIRGSISGISAVNTLPVISPQLGNPTKQGGISGRPIFTHLISQLQELRKHYPCHSDLPIFASGGIDSPQKAWGIIDQYKSLPFALTGFLLQGPSFYTHISDFIFTKLRKRNQSMNSVLA